jgi:hypothetical protein
VAGWHDVRAHFAAHGTYRYLKVDEAQYLLAGYPATWPTLMERMAAITGAQRGPDGWIRTTPPDAIGDLTRRWRRYLDGRNDTEATMSCSCATSPSTPR